MKKKRLDPYIKANRKGSWEAEMENDGKFKSVTKVHKSKKTYSRKNLRDNF